MRLVLENPIPPSALLELVTVPELSPTAPNVKRRVFALTSKATTALEINVELSADASADALLRALLDAGVGLRRFEVLVPTLHQIFVDRVGAQNAQFAERRDDGGPQ